MSLTAVQKLEGEQLGRRDMKVAMSIISFTPEALVRNPSKNAQKAVKHAGLDIH